MKLTQSWSEQFAEEWLADIEGKLLTKEHLTMELGSLAELVDRESCAQWHTLLQSALHSGIDTEVRSAVYEAAAALHKSLRE